VDPVPPELRPGSNNRRLRVFQLVSVRVANSTRTPESGRNISSSTERCCSKSPVKRKTGAPRSC
jgi:hypothetical protein